MFLLTGVKVYPYLAGSGEFVVNLGNKPFACGEPQVGCQSIFPDYLKEQDEWKEAEEPAEQRNSAWDISTAGFDFTNMLTNMPGFRAMLTNNEVDDAKPYTGEDSDDDDDDDDDEQQQEVGGNRMLHHGPRHQYGHHHEVGHHPDGASGCPQPAYERITIVFC